MLSLDLVDRINQKHPSHGTDYTLQKEMNKLNIVKRSLANFNVIQGSFDGVCERIVDYSRFMESSRRTSLIFT